MADQTTDTTTQAATPAMPTLPVPPIPVQGDTLTIAIWTLGAVATYACTPEGQSMAKDVEQGCKTVNASIGRMVQHIEGWFGNLFGKIKAAI